MDPPWHACTGLSFPTVTLSTKKIQWAILPMLTSEVLKVDCD